MKAKIRVTLDEREGQSPGWKFNDWEMRGVPVRVELGPKDVAKQAAVLARRDRPGREGKISVSLTDVAGRRSKSCWWKFSSDVRQSAGVPALEHPRSRELRRIQESGRNGFRVSPTGAAAAIAKEKIKEETRATMRCIPLDQEAVFGAGGAAGTGKCVIAGKLPKNGRFSRGRTKLRITNPHSSSSPASGLAPTKHLYC